MFIANYIVGLLPKRLQQYGKALIPAGAAVITAIITFASTGSFNMDSMKAALGMAVAALLSFLHPNIKA